MNSLSGKCVNIVLAVEMGRGMDFLAHPVKIVANFNARPLESDLVEPDDSPLFKTELIWETEKRELRKVRSTNAPLRVEVQYADKKHRRDRVGFLLLGPRSASIIPFNSNSETPFKWQKLLGVAAEHKSCHPELYLSLTIRDMGTAIPEEPRLVDVEEDDIEEAMEEPFEKDGQIIPMKYLPDGFIQIGSESCDETFLLRIHIQVAYNLDLLLPEVLVFNQCREKYYVSFKMFGITIKSKPFCRDLHANIPMNEKIIVRLRSNYGILRAYFTEYCQILVCFYCGRDKLGMTKLEVDSLLKGVSEDEFLSKTSNNNFEQKCFFKFPSVHGIVPTGPHNRQPFIEVATSVVRAEIRPISAEPTSTNLSLNTKMVPTLQTPPSIANIDTTSLNNEQQDIPATSSLPTTPPPQRDEDEVNCTDENGENSVSENPTLTKSPKQNEIRCVDTTDVKPISEPSSPKLSPRQTEEGCGDEGTKEEEKHLSPTVSACGDQNESTGLVLQKCPGQTQLGQVLFESQSAESVVTIPSPSSTIQPEDIAKKVQLYQQYCLDVILESLTLKKVIKSNKLCFKFKHPKAATVTTVTSMISTEDNCVGENIILDNTRCKMYFISSTEHIRKMVYAWGPKLVLTDQDGTVLTEELDLYTAMFLAKQRTQCSYITEWKAIRTYEPLAKINITMYLLEYDLQDLPQPTDYDLLPIILDEELALKELQELQEWKTTQKVQFSADLTILQKQRIKKLQKDWAKRKKQLEEKLCKSVLRCQNLSEELQTAVNSIRTKRALELKELELNSQPNGTFKDNVQKNTSKYCDYANAQLIETISKLERDNEHLRGIIDDQRHEMQQIKKTALTKEQTTNLLQQLKGLEEKFEGAQKAKTYFKDQWKKAVREIHDLRSEEQKQLQEKIQNHKIELSQLSLDSFVHSEIGSGRAASYGRAEFTVPPYGDFKWNSLDFSIGRTQSMAQPYNSTNI